MALDSDLIAEAFPQYEIGEEVGRGGWGVVLRGTHRQLGRAVAIKQLPRAFASDPAVRRRFTSEARLLASLDHPHVVPIYDYVEHEVLCLLVMELLPGGTVWDRFTRQGVAPEAACGIVLASCTALEYAHRAGILHRDIKPENLLFTGAGTVKVTDFGIAKVLGDSLTLATRTGEVLGTPAYMAPEQAMGRDLTAATDIYALGVLTYELLAGRPPFTDDGNAVALLLRHVHEQPTPLRDVAPQIPEPIAAVVMRALATDPAGRPESAETYGTELADACNEAWGRGWMERSGVAVMASGPIAERLSTQQHVEPSADVSPVAPPARPTVADAELHAPSRATNVETPRPSNVVPVSELVSDAGGTTEVDVGTDPTAGARPPIPPPPPAEPPPGLKLDPAPGVKTAPGSRSRLSRALPFMLVIIVVAAAVVLGFVIFGGGGGDGSGSSAEAVTVPGNEAFVDTGINLKSGDEVTITAAGTVIHDLTTPTTLVSGPDGDADRPDLQQFNVPGLPAGTNHSNLIGKIGQDGTPFTVGSKLDFTAESDGRLFLGINDAGVFNNGGEFEARVSVKP